MTKPNFGRLKLEVLKWIEDARFCFYARGLGEADASDSLRIAISKITEFQEKFRLKGTQQLKELE